MPFIADFHIHSRYSIGTSKSLSLEQLHYWARIKGITVLGTGDCIHPAWLLELKQKLIPSDNGLYILDRKFWLEEDLLLSHPNIIEEVYFILTTEISSIYKKNAKVRKIHSLCVFEDFTSLRKVQSKLEKIGNIKSDGRPILGLDPRVLLSIILESSPFSYLIPAHIWTPWFSLFGSRSGFDSVNECFDDLAPYIFALETGLSSNPYMNRLCGILDDFKLISNSDAHSAENIGREATIFNCTLSYMGILDALRDKHDKESLMGTIEFFPEEGKYFFDGHRKCNISYSPAKTKDNGGICEVCGKAVTIGVFSRVLEIASRKEPAFCEKFYSITPLPSILAKIMQIKNTKSIKVRKAYLRLISLLGSELYILLFIEDLELLKKTGGELLYIAINNMRSSRVSLKEGFDGEFGSVNLF